MLVAGRALQGVFGALLTPSALALIVAASRRGARGRDRLVDRVGRHRHGHRAAGRRLADRRRAWRWIFAINVPFVIATLLLVRVAVAERPRTGRAGPRVDWLGAALCALGLAGPVFALIQQPRVGWASPEVLGPGLVGGMAMLALFLVHEARTPHPMLPLGLFRRRNFAVGNLETLAHVRRAQRRCSSSSCSSSSRSRATTALQAGLATLPTTVVMFVLSRRAGRPRRPLSARAVHGRRPAASPRAGCC